MSQTERQETKQETRPEIKPDLCVIGAGAGGLAAAAAAAAFGVNVVLIERGPIAHEDRSGGHRDTGALGSKAFLAAAAYAHGVRQGLLHQGISRDGGGDDAGFAVNFVAVRDYVRDVVAAAAPETSRERINGLGVRIFQGAARFTDPHTVAVNGYDVRARRFIIATGSAPALPDIPGLADVPYLTPETVFDLKVCPRHLIVIGAQPIGLELAQAFARFGAAVTVLEAATPLPGADAECAAIVLDALAREGIAVRAGVAINRVRGEGDGVAADIAADNAADGGSETIEGSHILIAAGRRPDVETLGLEAAGIRYDASGIAVDRGLRTSNRQVYAIGEVTGAAALNHLVRHQAGLVVRNALFRTPVRSDGNAIPSVIYTDPELAHVGHTEDQARAAVGRIRVLRSSYGENDRARASGTTTGHVKVVTDRKGAILGTTIVGPGAAEAIVAWTLAISQRLNIEAMAGVIVPYPTYAEVGKRAAMTYFTRGLTSPLVRRIIGWLRRFG